MNDIRGGRVTSYMDDRFNRSRVLRRARSRDRAKLVNALKAANWERSSRASTRFSLEPSVHNLAIQPFQSNFSPTQE